MSQLLGHAQAARIIAQACADTADRTLRIATVKAGVGELKLHEFEHRASSVIMLGSLCDALTLAAGRMEQAMRDQCSPGPAAPGEPE